MVKIGVHLRKLSRN